MHVDYVMLINNKAKCIVFEQFQIEFDEDMRNEEINEITLEIIETKTCDEIFT